jgi:DNA-binding FadR family transcriptional regulator
MTGMTSRGVFVSVQPGGARRPARGQNLTYGIASELGASIVRGEFSKDNPFPIEGELCKQFGVSRSILREAVKMLTAKGLLGARPRQGTFVQPEDQWNLLDPDVLRWLLERKVSLDLLIEFNEIRLAVEPAAAALAARFAGARGKAAIAAAIARMQAAERGDDDALASDIAFHVAVLHASGNRFYAQLSGLTETALRFSIGVTNSFKGVRLASAADHKKVSDAILAGDAPAAEAAMRFLAEEVLDLMLQANGGGRRLRGPDQDESAPPEYSARTG